MPRRARTAGLKKLALIATFSKAIEPISWVVLANQVDRTSMLGLKLCLGNGHQKQVPEVLLRCGCGRFTLYAAIREGVADS